jgi:hypothetical protein
MPESSAEFAISRAIGPIGEVAAGRGTRGHAGVPLARRGQALSSRPTTQIAP